MGRTKKMEPDNRSRKETEKRNPVVSNRANSESDEPKNDIDKARAELKILKKFIDNSQIESEDGSDGNTDKEDQ